MFRTNTQDTHFELHTIFKRKYELKGSTSEILYLQSLSVQFNTQLVKLNVINNKINVVNMCIGIICKMHSNLFNIVKNKWVGQILKIAQMIFKNNST